MTSQKQAIQQELLERATGKGSEPSWAKDHTPTQLEMVKALNFYSAHADAEKLQGYAITWAKKNRPDLLELISAQPAWHFQTYGALMRLDSRGMKLSAEHAEVVRQFLDGLRMPVVDETKSSKPKNRKKKNMSNVNTNYQTFCDSMDQAVAAGKYVAPNFEVDKKVSVAPIVEVAQRELESLKDDPSIYPEHMKKWFRAVIKHVGGVEAAALDKAANDAVNNMKKAAKPAAEVAEPVAPKAPTKPKAATPKPKAEPKPKVEKAPKVTQVVKPENVPDDSANDHQLNGKKQAFLFDTRYGRLIRVVSDSKNGFQVKGKTLHNIDSKKSKVALLKNYGDAMKPGKSTPEQLAEWMTKCVKKGNPIAVGSRLAAEILVLSAA